MAQKKISDLQLRSDADGTCQFPVDDASQTWRVTAAQLLTYMQANTQDLMRESRSLWNLGLLASVSGNALTIALKNKGGSSDPSSSSPVKIGFRDSSAGNGAHDIVSCAAATSLVISSGSTLGMISAVEGFIYVYALNNGGTIELAASTRPWDEGTLATTVAEGGAGGADTEGVLYSTTQRTSKAIRLIGRIRITEATAGTWATAPSEVSLWPFNIVCRPKVTTYTSGSGNHTVATPAPKRLRVLMAGGGGGGGGSGTTSGTAATDGGDSTFGSSLLTAAKGTKGTQAAGGAGGTTTVNSPAIAIRQGTGGEGDRGHGGFTATTVILNGGRGGSNWLGGVSGQGADTTTPATPPANTGAGGGGAGAVGHASGQAVGSGGGAGGALEAVISNPVAGATYAYGVGAAGTGQGAGSNGFAGGDGAAGKITVIEEWE